MTHSAALTLRMLCALAFFSSIVPLRLSAQQNSTDLELTLTPGLLSSNDHYVISGNPGFLQPSSRVSGADYRDSLCRFTIAVADYDGDGVFNKSGIDWIALTVYQDRILRINNNVGTAHAVVGKTPLLIFVDSVGFWIKNIAADGKRLTLQRAPARAFAKADLRVCSRVPAVSLATLTGKPVEIQDFLHKGKFLYLYFFNSRPLEYQMTRLKTIREKYSDKVQIMGLYLPFTEEQGFQDNDGFLLKAMANPWPHAVCTLELYGQLQQDYSYYRGVFVDDAGDILEINISPKELLGKLESLFGPR